MPFFYNLDLISGKEYDHFLTYDADIIRNPLNNILRPFESRIVGVIGTKNLQIYTKKTLGSVEKLAVANSR